MAPSLAFPVEGHDAGDIRSRFGADRDAGRRVHHGVDIFAPRGTPVLAAAEGPAEPRLNRLGGKVVWQRVSGLGSLYYAHLDSQAVAPGTMARIGDTLGFVGNTGNAVTTPPHLHFGIYARPGGPVDPFPFIYEPEAVPPDPLGADVPLGMAMRTTERRTILQGAPSPGAETDTLPAGTVGRLVGGAGQWRRLLLLDGRTGWVRAAELAAADPAQPLRAATLPEPAVLRTRPDSSSLAIAELPEGATVGIVGRLGDWQWVAIRDDAGVRTGRMPLTGWIRGG